jgi:putative aldouronate transport system substrate-binding protein
MEELAEVAVSDPSFGLISKTFLEKGSQLNTILNDATIKFVTGAIDETGFYKAVEIWKQSGGTEVAKEFEELFKNKKK